MRDVIIRMIGAYLDNIKDDDCLQFVLEKMIGNMLLLKGFTEEDEITIYTKSPHVNYFIPSGDGFLCVSEMENYVTIPFAWHIGKLSTQKEMVKLGKELYKKYTIGQGKSILYTGLKNFYGHNSRKIADNVWIFEPKNL